MDRRLFLQKKLEEIPGVEKVYFQPPSSVRMVYPCIRYSKGRTRSFRADNFVYRFNQGYNVIVITPDPDSPIPQYIAEHFQMAEVDSTYVSDNLYHTPITLYY